MTDSKALSNVDIYSTYNYIEQLTFINCFFLSLMEAEASHSQTPTYHVLIQTETRSLPRFFLKLLSSSVQLIIQAVPVIGLLFIAGGYVGSTHV